MAKRVQSGKAATVKARTPKTQPGKSNLTATTVVVQDINLNGKVPNSVDLLGTMGYRIGVTDREVGTISNEPEGFVVLNTTNGNVFQTINGEWCSLGPIGNFDGIDDTLLPAWHNTIPSGPPGYRVGATDRSGAADGYPNGFLVWNQTNGSVFAVSGGTLSGGVWSGGTWGVGTFTDALKIAWYESEGVSYVKSNIIQNAGKAKIV